MAENITVVDPFYIYVNDWTKYSISIFFGISVLLGVPGNSLVVIVHSRLKEKTVTDWMIFYVAVCDIMSLINIPLYLCQLHVLWPLGFPDFLCKYHYFNTYSVSMSSYFFCAIMALERYFKVVTSKDMTSLANVKYIWIPVFLISYGIGSLVIFYAGNNPNGHCGFDFNKTNLATVEYAIMLFVAFVSTLVMIMCYGRVSVFLHKKMKEICRGGTSFSNSYKNTLQTTKMLAIVTLVFLFSSNTPYIVGVVFAMNQPDDEPSMSVLTVLSIIFFFNTFFNPLLYMAMSASFRKRSKRLLQSCCGSKYAPSEQSQMTSSVSG